ncbi:MAG: PIG-L family deacetylase [Chloroflexi bacterium]|nr:PIG-L family deacetylase [Chloroflexota bacterium]
MTLRSVVAFFAHPDDETVLAGGLIALLARQGAAVHIVCATRGEGGEAGEPPVVLRRELLGTAREAELRCAARALGATVTVLDYVDPTIGPDEALFPFECDFTTLAGQFADIARQRRADLVLTHGGDGEYGHPAHQLVNQAVLYAIPRALPGTLVYTVAALVPQIEDRLWNASEPAHLALDIRPWAEAKVQAMECHVSQHALFKRRRQLQTVREALRTVESVRRAWPEPRGEPPRDAFADLLRTAGAWQP